MPSKTNTADIATLGLAPLQLVACMFWRYEPEFLTLPKSFTVTATVMLAIILIFVILLMLVITE